MNGALATLLFLGVMPTTYFTQAQIRPLADGIGRAGINGRIAPPDPRMPFLSHNVSILSQVSLQTMGASSGNDIWGYVSPSGREYALVSLRNKVAFVEVTNPTAPVYFANIPHTSSTWGDVKVYGNHCYIVTEASGTGIQVVNLANIDNHSVTLVRTITNPSRSHNVVVDTVSGFLYTAGSRNSTGGTFTACFDLSNPGNPQRVGPTSMTDSYQHDIAAVTYTEGPYAGRQILFGNDEGRGLAIWDVTDKNNPFLVVRRDYPDVEYCHQGWLSADRKYWYVNDELDESRNAVTTRTLVFNVEDITNPILVNTFSTGLPSIDHNLYVHGGYIFESNYTSGVRVFDTNADPVNPPQVGWFDTYPENDNTEFSGTWSNYPFLPSGILLVNDINRGLFVLDASEATVKPLPVTTHVVARGQQMSGTTASVNIPDGQSLVVRAGITLFPTEAPINVEFKATALWPHSSKLKLQLTGFANSPGLTRAIEMFDWNAGTWVTVSTGPCPTSTTSSELNVPNAKKYVNTSTKEVKGRIRVWQTGPTTTWPYAYSFDQFNWLINP